MSPLGPPVVIPAPQSGAPPSSLIRSALTIDHTTDLSLNQTLADIADGNGGTIGEARDMSIDARWGNGIEFQPSTCDDATIFDPCAPAPAALDNDFNRPAVRPYAPFAVNAWDRCSTLGFEAGDYETRALQMMAARESKAIAKEFWTGALNAANPHLADNANVTASVGTGLSPHNGLSLLVQAIADGNGGVGMIHVRPRLLEMLATKAFLRWENGQWYTARGVKVVADDGYPGTGPTGQAIVNNAGAITEWAFATDLVEVHRGPVKVFAASLTAQTIAHQSNDELVRAQRLAAPIWNGCVLAVASITTPAVD